MVVNCVINILVFLGKLASLLWSCRWLREAHRAEVSVVLVQQNVYSGFHTRGISVKCFTVNKALLKHIH